MPDTSPMPSLRESLATYRRFWPNVAHASHQPGEEPTILARFADFLEREAQPFARTTQVGHVTGSALVVSPDFKQVLLTLHGKLGIWLQLGGHADGDPQPHQVAWREVQEESGLTKLAFLPYERHLSELAGQHQGVPVPFDFDIHLIPQRPGEPEHLHYDVRYVIVANPAEPLVISSESKDLRWCARDEARHLTRERSMLRQFDKIDWLQRIVDRAV